MRLDQAIWAGKRLAGPVGLVPGEPDSHGNPRVIERRTRTGPTVTEALRSTLEGEFGGFVSVFKSSVPGGPGGEGIRRL